MPTRRAALAFRKSLHGRSFAEAKNVRTQKRIETETVKTRCLPIESLSHLDCTLEVNTRKWWLCHLLARLGRDQFSDYFQGAAAVCDRPFETILGLLARLSSRW